MNRIAAVDFETNYDAECSIVPLGIYHYVRHPRYEAYLVSIVTSEGFEWCGHPKDAPWHLIAGPDWTWISHNAAFDDPVYRRLQETGIAPAGANPAEWHCTADLCAFIGSPRSLAGAFDFLYGEKLDKSTRDAMKGQTWDTMTPEFRAEAMEYALVDARKCLKLWDDHAAVWYEKERRLSVLTRRAALRGLHCDADLMRRGIDHLKRLAWAAEQKIPWMTEGLTALSKKGLAAECERAGIPCPKSLKMDDDDCLIWEEKYGSVFPWVAAMRLKRRTNMLLTKLETMLSRLQDNGRIGYGLKYFGAHTGRWSGDAGWNPQNLPHGEMFGCAWWDAEGKDLIGDVLPGPTEEDREANVWGVDLRRCIIPAPGYHFGIADLSQIEPRALWRVCGDYDSLALVRTGMSPYEAHARTTMGYTNPAKMKSGDPAGYRLAKARVLALGYAAGWLKFITMAKIYDAEACFDGEVTEAQTADFTDYLDGCNIAEWNLLWATATPEAKRIYVNSWLIVMGFRQTNPKIKALWGKLGDAATQAIGKNLELPLPSGRKLIYRNVHLWTDPKKRKAKPELCAWVVVGGRAQRKRIYGGLLTENYIQALARDVFAEGLLRLDDAGHDVPVHIHDEAVAELPLEVSATVVGDLLAQPPVWMPDLPVASECESHSCYTK